MATVSLSSIQPEDVPHGIDIVISASVGNGTFIDVGEIYEMDYSLDEGMVKLPTLGTRITGERPGKLTITGSIKAYWLNRSMRQMLNGAAPDGDGIHTRIYASSKPFERYNIKVLARVTNSPVLEFRGVTFGKDDIKWTESSFTEETISWSAEDMISYDAA